MTDSIITPTAVGTGRVRGVMWGTAAAAVALDALTKAWAQAALADGRSIPIIGDFLQLHLLFNSGAAFSMGRDSTLVVTLVAAVVLGVIAVGGRRVRNIWWALALGAMAGGAVGNLLDRVFRAPGFLRGHVVDFFQVPNFPVFNVADIFITCGAVAIIALSMFGIDYDRPGRSGTGGADDE